MVEKMIEQTFFKYYKDAKCKANREKSVSVTNYALSHWEFGTPWVL